MRRDSKWHFPCLALALGLLLGLSASEVASEEPPSTFRATATVTLIEVPVVVMKGGTPVRDLSADDFVLTQDGVEQGIVGFERVDLSVAKIEDVPSSDQPVSLAGRRYFLLAFDLSHTQPANARRAVEAARGLMVDGLHPTDLVGVSVYGAVAGARLLHPFTSDRSELASALLAVEAVTSRDPAVVKQARATLKAAGGRSAEDLIRFLEEIRVFATNQGVGLQSTTGPAGEWLVGFDGSGRGAVMAETLQDMEAFHDDNIVYITRDRSFDLLETLSDLASALEEVRGQKYFVLFSEGIDHSFFEDYSNTQGTRRLADLLKSFRRSGWVMQSVNLARVTDTERGMFALVEETGGREYREFHRLDEAMGQMLEQTSVSYVLSFQPTALVADGGYHRIEVRLRQSDRGRVTHRDGFFAPRETVSTREEDFLVALADRVASEKDGGPFAVAAMAVPFKGTADKALVKTIVEIDGSGLFKGASASLLPLEIETYLVDETLGAVSLSSRRVTLDLAQQGELLKNGGIKVVEDYLLGPGHHRIRVSVVDGGGGRRSVATASVRVPDFRDNEAEVLEPVFPELSRDWLVVRDDPGAADSLDSRPLQFGGRNFIPRVDVSLEAGLRVPICILAFDLPQSEPALEIELVTANGGPSIDGHLQLVSDPERTENGLLRVMAQLDTTDLMPGEYEIRVSFDGGRDSTHSRAVRIR